MASEIRVNTFKNRSGFGTITVNDDGANFSGIVTAASFSGNLTGNVTGNLTGTASTATAAATAYGLSGSPTLSGISSVSTTNLTVNGNAYPATGPLSNRNLIINGAMQVAQRGTQTTSVSSGHNYICDRFSIYVETLGTWTLDQSTDSPNGFSNSFKATCTTAAASPVSNAQCAISQKIEAQNLQSLGFGTSDAQATTLSFWVKSNKTGNASIVVFQVDNSNKMVSFQYSISSANTWEQKTITIPADTAGVINNDNGSGFQIEWWLNSGSNKTGGSHQVTWSTYDATNRNVSNLGVGGATSDYFAITGVQLEVGSVATPFEHRSFGDELRRCQRYYQKSYDMAVFPGQTSSLGSEVPSGCSNTYNNFVEVIRFPVTMRSAPVMTGYRTSDGTKDSWSYVRSGTSGSNTPTFDLIGTSGCRCYLDIGASWTVAQIEGHWVANAEL